MLTGDDERRPRRAEGLRRGRVVTEVLPADKQREVARLMETQAGAVAMVGDGISDARARPRRRGHRHQGGNRHRHDAADMVLMRGDLLDVSAAIRLSRHHAHDRAESVLGPRLQRGVHPDAAGALHGRASI
ncbi:MAG: hypothetical protein ACLT98_09900 [Eggerthellaceae bacterium]